MENDFAFVSRVSTMKMMMMMMMMKTMVMMMMMMMMMIAPKVRVQSHDSNKLMVPRIYS